MPMTAGTLTPRTNTELFGHNAAEAQFLRDLDNGKLAHGWLISGPEGIGKATLVYRFARIMLGMDDRTASRITAGSHTDMLVIEPIYDPKKEEFAREISVEQAREIGQFLSLTPGEGAWRVVIVDAIDQLNNNAANAILKILEEPPAQAILLLISHNPGKLLPTIRSRCRNLRLAPLGHADFAKVMEQLAPDADMHALGELSGYSPGVALKLKEQGAAELYAGILDIVETATALHAAKIHAFAETIGTGAMHANWRIFSRLMLTLLARVAQTAAGAEVRAISTQESLVLRKLAELHPAHVWAEKWQAAASQFSLAEARHLDYKQIIITFFHSLNARESAAA